MMKLYMKLLATSLLVRISFSEVALWPQPVHVETGSEVLWIDRTVRTVLRCEDKHSAIFTPSAAQRTDRVYGPVIQTLVNTANELWLWTSAYYASWQLFDDANVKFSEARILRSAVRETIHALQNSAFVPWKFHGRASTFEPDLSTTHSALSSLTLIQEACPSTKYFNPGTYFQGDESYQIVIRNNSAEIKTNSTIGTLRALETFKQLFYAHSSSIGTYTPHAPILIYDSPRWNHRGLSLDISRNGFSPDDALRTIDAMASAKFNRLHIHATDSQSWPLEIPSLPDLAAKGAYRPELVWTAADLEEVQACGASRGISVFIEIDMPGHTASIAHAYPELITAFNEPDWSTFAAEPLSGQLKLNSTRVNKFLDALMSDLLPRMNAYTHLYHAGGDEVNLPAYLLDETVQSNDTQILQPLLQRMFDQIISHATHNNLQPMVWEEMILDWNLTLPHIQDVRSHTMDTLVQVWRSSENLQKVLEKGYSVLFGDYSHWYLDCGFGQFLDPYPSGLSPPGIPYNTSGGQRSRLKEPYLDYCAPLHNWRQIYTYNPLEKVDEILQDRIEGGEVLMWSEQTDGIDLDFKLWPRAAAAAEVLWAGPQKAGKIEDASRRLGHWRERLTKNYGIGSSPVHMTWCHMEGGCQY